MTDKIEIKVVDGITCPNCGAPEVDPKTLVDGKIKFDTTRWNIKPFKVQTQDGYWWSKCLVCEDAGRECWF